MDRPLRPGPELVHRVWVLRRHHQPRRPGGHRSRAAVGWQAGHGPGQPDRVLASYCPSRVVAARDNGDMLVYRYHLDALTGRFEAEPTVIRSGRTRRVNFVKRLFGFPELRDWLLAAGFTAVTGYGEDGRPLTADHK